MPLWVAALVGGLVQVAGTLVGRVLVSLGIGYVTFTGVDASLTWASGQFVSAMGGLPAASVQIAGLLKVGTCVSMLLSAVAARLLLAGLTSGAITKFALKG